MIIRSQDKKEIHNLDRVSNIAVLPCLGNENVFLIEVNRQHTIGTYSTEEKAIKVLDMIQKEYEKHIYGQGGAMATADYYVPPFAFIPPKVFQMPTDEEI